jgi:hypothetical protein
MRPFVILPFGATVKSSKNDQGGMVKTPTHPVVTLNDPTQIAVIGSRPAASTHETRSDRALARTV